MHSRLRSLSSRSVSPPAINGEGTSTSSSERRRRRDSDAESVLAPPAPAFARQAGARTGEADGADPYCDYHQLSPPPRRRPQSSGSEASRCGGGGGQVGGNSRLRLSGISQDAVVCEDSKELEELSGEAKEPCEQGRTGMSSPDKAGNGGSETLAKDG